MHTFKTALVLLVLALAALLGAPRPAHAQQGPVSLGADDDRHFGDYWLDANRPLLRPEAAAAIVAGTVRPSDRSVFGNGPVRYGLVAAANAPRMVTATELICLNRDTRSLVLGCHAANGDPRYPRLSARTCAGARSVEDLLPRGCTAPFTMTMEGRPVLIRRAAETAPARAAAPVAPTRSVRRQAADPPPRDPPVPRPEARPHPTVSTTVPAPQGRRSDWPWTIVLVTLAIAGLALVWWLVVRPRIFERRIKTLTEKNEGLEGEVSRLEQLLAHERSRKPTAPIPQGQRPTDLLKRIDDLAREKTELQDQRDAEEAANGILGDKLREANRLADARTKERDAALRRATEAEKALAEARAEIGLLKARPAATPVRAPSLPRISVPPPPATTAGKAHTPPGGSLSPTPAPLPTWSDPPPGTTPLPPPAATASGPAGGTERPARPSGAGTNRGAHSDIRVTQPLLRAEAEAAMRAVQTQPVGSPDPDVPLREERSTLVGIGGTDAGDVTSMFRAEHFSDLFGEGVPEPAQAPEPSVMRWPTVKIRPGAMAKLGQHSVDRERFPSVAPESLSAVPGPNFGKVDSVAVPPPPRLPDIGAPEGQDDGPHEESGARRVS